MSLVGYYKLDNNMADAAGNYDGIDVDINYGPGKKNMCRFSGIGKMPAALSSSFSTNGLSISLWVNTSTEQSNRYLISHPADITGVNGFDISIQGNHFTLINISYTPNLISIPQTVPYDGKWHNLVFTVLDSEVKGYLDSKLLITQPVAGALSNSGNSWYIGSFSDSLRLDFLGKTDEVKFYNHILTQAEISAGYNSSSGFFNFFK